MKTKQLVKHILPPPSAMRKVLFFACALLTLASCSNDEFTGQDGLGQGNGQGAISFGSGVGAVTRADKTGAAAATDLNGQFYVYAVKNENADGIAAATAGNLVFKNYVVKWVNNSAFTTTSNTEGWEYVSYTLGTEERTNVTENSGADAQTIKYWDFGATDYTFYAFSALPADITSGKVSVAKIKSVTAPADKYEKGYTVTLGASANLDKLFFSERVPIAQSAGTDRTADNTYGGNVTFRFHNMATKVRVAMYETNPGYSVTIKKFKVDDDGADPEFAAMTDNVSANFAANFQNCGNGTAGTMTVKYISAAGTTQNHPTVSFDGTTAKVLNLGTNLKATTVLGTNISGATYDKSDKSYTSVFPKEANTQNLKLKLDYTLTAPKTNETIEIEGATAEIPAQYLQWKPGYAYTYIFKITDDKLYPITFDAVEVIAEDGVAEYITTVSEPSITTFGVKVNSSDEFQEYVTGGSDYLKPTGTDKLDIYATIVDDGTVITPVEGTNVNYYSIAYKALATDEEKAGTPITEGAVAEVIAENPASPLIVCTKNNELGAVVTTVPGEDGVNITGTHAVKFANMPAGIYAIEYITTQTYYTSGTTYATPEEFTAAGTLYKDAAGTEVADASYYSAHTGDTYYKREGIKKHAKTYKIITVTAAP